MKTKKITITFLVSDQVYLDQEMFKNLTQAKTDYIEEGIINFDFQVEEYHHVESSNS